MSYDDPDNVHNALTQMQHVIWTLSEPAKWVQGGMRAMDAQGHACPAYDANAVRWSLLGAIDLAYHRSIRDIGDDAAMDANALVSNTIRSIIRNLRPHHVGFGIISRFNNDACTTFADVVHVMGLTYDELCAMVPERFVITHLSEPI